MLAGTRFRAYESTATKTPKWLIGSALLRWLVGWHGGYITNMGMNENPAPSKVGAAISDNTRRGGDPSELALAVGYPPESQTEAIGS